MAIKQSSNEKENNTFNESKFAFQIATWNNLINNKLNMHIVNILHNSFKSAYIKILLVKALILVPCK